MRSRYFNMAGSTSEKRINPSRGDSKGSLRGGVEAEVKRPGLHALRCQVFLASAEAEVGRVNAPSEMV